MLMFWIAASLMIAVALIMVLPALLAGWRDSDGGRDAVNVAIFQEQLGALERERASGAIGEDEYEVGRLAIERQMLSDLDDDGRLDGARDDAPGRRGSMAGIAVAVALPLAALGMYFHFGDPASLMSQPAAETAPATGPLSGEAARQIPHSVQEMVASLEARLRSQPERATRCRRPTASDHGIP
jgi:cytochrome c-type biogenesis protein CcmH